MARRLCLAVTLLVLGTVPGAADVQPADELEQVLNRLGRYLLAYDSELSTVIAEERYEQTEITTNRPGRNALETRRRRRLDSDIAFLRLPDGSNTTVYGVRDVQKMNGKAVGDEAGRLLDMVKRLGGHTLDETSSIVLAGAQHSLGMLRTINVPSTPLELLHPSHHVQFVFRHSGRDRIGGVTTVKVGFEEFDEPTLIKNTDGSPLFVTGTAWVEPERGQLWRVDLAIRRSASERRRHEGQLRVDFAHNAALDMLVPREMQESFFVPRGRGTGRAVYSNYRRFSTAVRVLP